MKNWRMIWPRKYFCGEVLQLLWGGPMDIASVFAWFAQESLSIAEQANEPKQQQTFTQLALLWATAAQQCSGGAKLASAWREDAEALKRGEKAAG